MGRRLPGGPFEREAPRPGSTDEPVPHAAHGPHPTPAQFAPPDDIAARWDAVPPPDDPDVARGSDEARLIARLAARDEQAFNALVRAYERRVFGLVLRMLGNREEAEDLAQEVFVQVFKAVGSFRGESKLSTWIYRIAINLCKNRSKYLRVRHAGQQDELEAMQDRVAFTEVRPGAATVAQVERPDEMMAGRQVERIVQRAILTLEPSFRECLVLRDVEDLSYEEIGQITGLPEGTVKSRIHRARAQLKELVEQALGEKIP
jgi:RNA polymerase sigma-70 factor (ECF subfamily)